MTVANGQDKGNRFIPTSPWFNLQVELQRHAWYPNLTVDQAEKVLFGKPMYTYLLRPSPDGCGFCISFVAPNKQVMHDHFDLIDSIYGIFRNSGPAHVGSLGKVIRDLMHCSLDEGAPLA